MKTYTEIHNHLSLLELETDNMDIDVLIDECSHLMIMYDSEIMESSMSSYFQTGTLSETEVKSSKAFYALAYSKYIWSE